MNARRPRLSLLLNVGLLLLVLPALARAQEDLVILDDEIATDWTPTGLGGMKWMGFANEGQVFAGQTAAVLQVERVSLNWRFTIKAPEPVEAFGYSALRFAFHPGDLGVPDSPRRFLVDVKPGKSVDLLENELFDLNLAAWQVVEIDLWMFDAENPLEQIGFVGNFAGTFYLDDLRLVRALDTVPSIAAIAPADGLELGDTKVEIRGSNFAEGATVALGQRAPRVVRRLSPFLIEAVTLSHSPGSVDVTVTNPSQETGTLEKGFTFFSTLFGFKEDYEIESEPGGLCSADWDGDGDSDLAVARWRKNDVGVLMNQGDGTFAPKVDYPVGTRPLSVFGADLDGDGDHDLAVAQSEDDDVGVLMNQGDGTFAPKVDYRTGENSIDIFPADLDGDGDLDLATANCGTNDISVLLNQGDGTFVLQGNYATADCPVRLFAADLDGDGDHDLAVGNEGGPVVSVLMNNGDGTFAPKVEYAGGPSGVFSADLDGDGDQDLAVTARLADGVSVLMNQGDGTFAPKVDYSVGERPRDLFAADLDGDGDPDVAVASSWSDAVSVLSNRGDGTFVPKVDYRTGDWPIDVLVADWDGDGDQDLAVGNSHDQSISVLLNTADRRPLPFVVPPPGDLVIWEEALSEGWFVESDLETVAADLAQTEVVFEGSVAAAFQVAQGPRLWQVSMMPPSPVVTFGYTAVSFAFHPGTAQGSLIRIGLDQSISLSLLRMGQVDMERKEWQVVEIPIEALYRQDPMRSIVFTGNLEGTFYIDDLRLVAALPLTAVEEGPNSTRPSRFSLAQNYPNPFNGTTIISFALLQRDRVTLILYNLAGQKVATLVDDLRPAGTYTVAWDGRDVHGRELASGVYLYRLQAGAQVQTRKLVLVR